MERVPLTLACWDYDRTRALIDGTVAPAGIELTYVVLPPGQTFSRMLRSHEFDVSEMSLSAYVESLTEEEPPFIAIPVFPSRIFRHSSIYVSTAAGIREPRDLIGKRVGVPHYPMTAAVWIRGLLSDDFGISPADLEYYEGGLDEPKKADLPPPRQKLPVKIHDIPKNSTLSDQLTSGEIAGLYTARIPASFGAGDGRVRRLFPNYGQIERAYYRRTRIFPIMHTVVIRRGFYRERPWVATSLYEAFCEAQRRCYIELYDTNALRAMLPWLIEQIEDLRRDFGEDWWPYGFNANRHVIETFLRYHYEQSLSPRLLAPEELFVPAMLAT